MGVVSKARGADGIGVGGRWEEKSGALPRYGRPICVAEVSKMSGEMDLRDQSSDTELCGIQGAVFPTTTLMGSNMFVHSKATASLQTWRLGHWSPHNPTQLIKMSPAPSPISKASLALIPRSCASLHRHAHPRRQTAPDLETRRHSHRRLHGHRTRDLGPRALRFRTAEQRSRGTGFR